MSDELRREDREPGRPKGTVAPRLTFERIDPTGSQQEEMHDALRLLADWLIRHARKDNEAAREAAAESDKESGKRALNSVAGSAPMVRDTDEVP